MTNAKNSGIYWYRPTITGLVPKLASWNTVILNDANVYDLPEQPNASKLPMDIKAINPLCKVGISFNGLSVFGRDNSTAGNPYFPSQVKIFQAAEETGAWLKHNGVKMSTVPPTAAIQTIMFDIRVPAFRYRLADIINSFMDSYVGVDFYHIDELHRTLGFMAGTYPTGLPTEAEWTAANQSLIRMIDFPVMGNGNYDLSKYHKTKSRGRYRQNATSVQDTLVDLKYDLELPIKQRWSIVNPINPLTAQQKADWAKMAYATGVGVQRWVSGAPNQYANPDLETLSF